jgi:amino acid transporter
MKKLFNDERWKPILMLLGNIAIFDWIIFPGLTAASTFINMLTVLVFIAVFLFDLNYVKEKYFTKSEEEKALEAKWKADLEKKMKQVKTKKK